MCTFATELKMCLNQDNISHNLANVSGCASNVDHLYKSNPEEIYTQEGLQKQQMTTLSFSILVKSTGQRAMEF